MYVYLISVEISPRLVFIKQGLFVYVCLFTFGHRGRRGRRSSSWRLGVGQPGAPGPPFPGSLCRPSGGAGTAILRVFLQVYRGCRDRPFQGLGAGRPGVPGPLVLAL